MGQTHGAQPHNNIERLCKLQKSAASADYLTPSTQMFWQNKNMA